MSGNGLNIVVCVKQVLFAGELEIDSEGKVSERGVAFETNEWDKYAVEEALLLREKHGGRVTAVTLGPERADKVLRECLALGVDDVERLWHEAFEGSDGYTVACILAAAIKPKKPDLVLTGAQDDDGGLAMVGPMLAQQIGFPCVTLVTRIEADEKVLRVRRELEDNLEEQLEVDLPAVLAVQTGINQPRYPSLARIRRAMKREIGLKGVGDIGLEANQVGAVGSPTTVAGISLSEVSISAEILEGTPDEAVDQLIRALQEKGVV